MKQAVAYAADAAVAMEHGLNKNPDLVCLVFEVS